MKIIDAHHHLWNLESLRYEWLKGPNQLSIHLAGDLTPIRKDYFVSDYANDTKNQEVVKSVHLQAECSDELAETRWLQSVADSHGFPHAIIAHADLSSPNLLDVLNAYRGMANVRGIRQLLNWDPSDPSMRMCGKDMLKDDAWQRGFEQLAQFGGLSFDLQVWYHQLPEAALLAKRFPQIQIILNHTGMPLERTEEATLLWRDGMKQLATCSNVAAKISGLGMTDHNWSVDSIRPYVLHTIEAFGVDRCMFASNFPIDKLLSDYDKLFNAFKEIVSGFPVQDQQKLFHDNASKFYRI